MNRHRKGKEEVSGRPSRSLLPWQWLSSSAGSHTLSPAWWVLRLDTKVSLPHTPWFQSWWPKLPLSTTRLFTCSSTQSSGWPCSICSAARGIVLEITALTIQTLITAPHREDRRCSETQLVSVTQERRRKQRNLELTGQIFFFFSLFSFLTLARSRAFKPALLASVSIGEGGSRRNAPKQEVQLWRSSVSIILLRLYRYNDGFQASTENFLKISNLKKFQIVMVRKNKNKNVKWV